MIETRMKNWHIVFQQRDKKNEDKVLSELKFELRGVWAQDLPFSIKNYLRREKIKGWIMPPSWNTKATAWSSGRSLGSPTPW